MKNTLRTNDILEGIYLCSNGLGLKRIETIVDTGETTFEFKQSCKDKSLYNSYQENKQEIDVYIFTQVLKALAKKGGKL